MSDPFRTNSKSQLIREAQVGLSVVAILLSLFLYVAYYKISGRGRQIPEHVRNAPMAEKVWADAPAEFDSSRSRPNPLDQRPNQQAYPAAKSHSSNWTTPNSSTPKPPIGSPMENQLASSVDKPNSFKPRGPSPNQQQGRKRPKTRKADVDRTLTRTKSIEQAKPASRVGKMVSGLPSLFRPRKTTNESSTLAPPIAASTSFSPNGTPTATSRRQSESTKRKFDEPMALSTAEATSKTIEPPNLIANGLRTTQHPQPSINSSIANNAVTKPDVQLTSANSEAFEPDVTNSFTPNQDFPERANADPKSLRPELPKSFPREQVATKPSPDKLSPQHISIGDFQSTSPAATSSNHKLTRKPANSPAASIMKKVNNNWQGDSQNQFLPNRFKPDPKAKRMPTLRSPQPLRHQTAEQPRRIPLPVQQDIAKTIIQDDLNQPSDSQEAQSPTEPTSHTMTYTVRVGDSYWSVAEHVYEDGRYFRALYEHNKSVIAEFELLPGTQLVTPTKLDLVKLWPELCPREDSDLLVDVEETKSEATSRIYVTKNGDTLFKVARQEFGQASRFSDIYDQNLLRLKGNVGPDTPLPNGMRLVLPPQ